MPRASSTLRGYGTLHEHGTWAIRGWPEGVREDRVREIQHVARCGRAAGCEFLPEYLAAPMAGATLLVWGGRVWDCARWIDGSQWRPGMPDEWIEQVGEAAGRFHRCVAPLGRHQGPVPAVAARLERLGWIQRELAPGLERLQGDIAGRGFGRPLEAVLADAVRMLRLRVEDGSLSALIAGLARWRTRYLPLQYVFRDLHLGNCLFGDSGLVGIVDLDAVRVDSPATDIARLIGSIGLEAPRAGGSEQDGSLETAVVAAYRRQWTFSPEEESLVPVLRGATAMASLANWIYWLGVEKRRFSESEAALERRLRHWTLAVAGGVDPSR